MSPADSVAESRDQLALAQARATEALLDALCRLEPEVALGVGAARESGRLAVAREYFERETVASRRLGRGT